MPTYFENADNILTLIGLTESAKRDTGETSTSLTHNSIGTDSTTATESDTNLAAEDTGGSMLERHTQQTDKERYHHRQQSTEWSGMTETYQQHH